MGLLVGGDASAHAGYEPPRPLMRSYEPPRQLMRILAHLRESRPLMRFTSSCGSHNLKCVFQVLTGHNTSDLYFTFNTDMDMGVPLHPTP